MTWQQHGLCGKRTRLFTSFKLVVVKRRGCRIAIHAHTANQRIELELTAVSYFILIARLTLTRESNNNVVESTGPDVD